MASNFVPDDTNKKVDVFVHDRWDGTTERVSVASDGTQGNENSQYPAISRDGRFVLFRSLASNLVSGDAKNANDYFVHDRLSGITEQVNIASDGSAPGATTAATPGGLSDNGRFVVFASSANLVPGDTNGKLDVFVRDRHLGTTESVSVASDGTEANGESGRYGCSISADGRFVAFYSEASNLVAGDTNGDGDIFVHDRQTGITERVSVASDGAEMWGYSHFPAINATGQFVVFEWSYIHHNKHDIFVHDRSTGITEQVSVASDGTPSNDSCDTFCNYHPSISDDGQVVAFASYASNLVAVDLYGRKDIFVHDRRSGSTQIASVGFDGYGYQTPYDSEYSMISGNGLLVAFEANHSLFLRYWSEPVAPVSNAGGPYAFCANVGTLLLDGTGSSNPDEGLSKPGAPGDTIQAYDWDLDDDGAFEDAAGATPDVTAFFEVAPEGVYPIALKVTDTTATSFPSSNLPDLSGVDASEVTVFDAGEPSCACVTNLAARVKSGKVQLTWTDVGAPGGYRVYRTDLPGGQFHAVDSVPPGSLYVDSNLVNGRSYRYALVTIAENGAESCPSNAVTATPRAR